MTKNSIKKAFRALLCSAESMAFLSSLITLWILTLLMYISETIHISADILLSFIVGVFVFRIIKLQQQFSETEYNKATQDPITNVYNKKYLYDIGKREIRSCLRNQYDLSVIIFRIDEYDKIFNIYGKKLVDQALILLTENIHTKTRQGDIFARLKDNEFVVLCPDASAETAEELARRIQLLTESLVCTYAPSKSIDFTCSIVITQYSPETDREFIDIVARIEEEIDSIEENEQLYIV